MAAFISLFLALLLRRRSFFVINMMMMIVASRTKSGIGTSNWHVKMSLIHAAE